MLHYSKNILSWLATFQRLNQIRQVMRKNRTLEAVQLGKVSIEVMEMRACIMEPYFRLKVVLGSTLVTFLTIQVKF